MTNASRERIETGAFDAGKAVAYENGPKREQVQDIVAMELRDKLLAISRIDH